MIESYYDYVKNVAEYLTRKLPNTDETTIMEIAQQWVATMVIHINDACNHQIRNMKRGTRR